MSTDSSSSSDDQRRKRKHKKHSSKKHKREKRHKEKKRSKRDDSPEGKVHQAVPRQELIESNENDDCFGPALPPHLLQKETKTEPQSQSMIGPVMPDNLIKAATVQTNTAVNNEDDDDDDLAGTFGPMPNATQVELEERALTLKLAALQGDGLGSSTTDQDVREEWMLELPEVGLKGGLAALNNMKRTFYQGKERPDFSDRSSWTKTPQSSAAAAAAGPKPSSSKDMEQAAQAKYERQRDEEQESIAKKHKKKHKRDESLVELHQKKLRKEQRKKVSEIYLRQFNIFNLYFILSGKRAGCFRFKARKTTF